MSIRRKHKHVPFCPPRDVTRDYSPRANNKPSKNWDDDYELVVRFLYGSVSDEAVSRVSGLRNYDTGTTMSGKERGIRDLMFPCGTDKYLALDAAQRLAYSDCFGVFYQIKISGPVETKGKDKFTPWYNYLGRLIERVKHRNKAIIVKRERPPQRKKKKA